MDGLEARAGGEAEAGGQGHLDVARALGQHAADAGVGLDVEGAQADAGPEAGGAQVARGVEREEQAVILEDDCLAHASFFGYCEALLERFRDDERVASITGSNTQGNRINAEARSYSYHFSAVGMPWGWATWRRAWRAYDARLELWPAFRRSGWLRDRLGHVAGGQWERVLDNAHEVDSWWVRWCMSCWCQGRLAIVPRVNLITNLAGKIQEGETTEAAIAARFGNLPTHPLESPLMHPPFVVRDPVAERRVLETMLPWSPVGRTVKQVLIEGHGTLRRFFPGGQ